MKLKPILFNTEMVRAILEGRKTQTRRIVKGIEGLNVYRAEPAEDAYETLAEWDFFHGLFFFCEENSGFADAIQSLRAPYAVGDILWVRETWSTTDKCGLFPNWPASFTHHYLYKADDGLKKIGAGLFPLPPPLSKSSHWKYRLWNGFFVGWEKPLPVICASR